MHEIYQQFIEGIKQTTWIEFIAVVSGVASVIFSRMENILVYPIGMINTIIYVYLYLTHGLYADASVNLFYTIMSIIGWFMWAAKKNGYAKLNVTKSTVTDWLNTLVFFIVCWFILFTLLKKFTDSTVPLADAFISAAAAVAMWLMNKKKLEN